ncbi:MAG: Mu transposase C-terminal domain-containing protein [Thermodesulfobacteriota bacterium]
MSELAAIGKSVIHPDRYRVNRGEPGANVVTLLKDGYPMPENLPMVPAILSDGAKPSTLTSQDEKAHYRYDLIRAIDGMISSRGKVKKEIIIKQSLLAYNSGVFLPAIRKKLGKISRSTFYELWKTFKEGSVEDLAPRMGRRGESKITEDEKNFLLTILLYKKDKTTNQNNTKIGTAIKLMKWLFSQKGIPSESGERTLRRYANQWKKEYFDQWVCCREGEKSLNDKVSPYIERDRNLIEVGDSLVADGHRLNLDVINPFTGKRCRPVIVVFLDWRSSYPLGWEIMLEESVQCIASALRNSILKLGKKPKWLLVDNGKAFKAKVFNSPIEFEEAGISGMFARLGINVHFSQPYNAQAKISERFWRTFTDWFERLMPSFRGSGIEDKPAYLKRNEKLARSMHDPWIPTIQELSHYINEWREFYIDQPSDGLNGKTPREIFESGRGPGVDPGELAFLMMPMDIKTIYRNGIRLFGYWWYNEELYGLRDRVTIRYSLFDLTQIYCFYKKEFLCVLTPREKAHPMASEGGTPKDMEDVKRMLTQKRSLKRQTVKLVSMFGGRQGQLPLKETIEEVQAVIETKKAVPRIISPFADDEPLDIAPLPSLGQDKPEAPAETSEPKPGSLIEKSIQDKDEIIFGQGLEGDSILFIDPRTNLNRPSDGTVFKNEFEYYEWYRAINEKFPGILTDEDWKKIERYEATEEWRDFYGKRGIPCMERSANGEQPQGG